MRFYKHRHSKQAPADWYSGLVSDITRDAKGNLVVKLHDAGLHDSMQKFLNELKMEMYFNFQDENVKKPFVFILGKQIGEFIITPKDVTEKEILHAFARENILSTRNSFRRSSSSY